VINESVRGTAPAETREIALSVSHVWKRYTQNERHVSLRHEAANLMKQWFQRERLSHQTPPFWALKDVSFTVHKGESLGIIGRNGAGKSTLFRVLSGVTEPTQGTVTVNGRFAPLLALGAGFNPELSGRKNIYLNAVMQGMKLSDIDKIVPQIIEFSELADFIDLPIKRYSSGMASRLGFSVAIHTLPDIVFLDEILAVGDAEFQEKCKTQILRLREEQRTILFVSHDAGAVRTLCSRAIWIDHGQLVMDGAVDEVLHAYQGGGAD